MLDDVTGEGVCVIDLNTTMNGSAVYNFGDMVHTATSPVGEDEVDTSKINMRMNMFEALVKGTNAFLTEKKRELLPFAGKLLTIECGTRFLSDYLLSDVYFKIHKDDHNLDRTRSQVALTESIENQMEAMTAVVAKYS